MATSRASIRVCMVVTPMASTPRPMCATRHSQHCSRQRQAAAQAIHRINQRRDDDPRAEHHTDGPQQRTVAVDTQDHRPGQPRQPAEGCPGYAASTPPGRRASSARTSPIDTRASNGKDGQYESGIEVRRAHRQRAQPQQIGNERRHGAAEHHRRGDHQQYVVEQQEALARGEVEACTGTQQRRAPHIQRQCPADHQAPGMRG